MQIEIIFIDKMKEIGKDPLHVDYFGTKEHILSPINGLFSSLGYETSQ
jgi:hypothetical protein